MDTQGTEKMFVEDGSIDAKWLTKLCLECGADDAGFVQIERSELDPERDRILSAFPWTKTLIGIVCRMNREPIRTPMRSVANTEFHHVGNHVNEVCHKIVRSLESHKFRAANPALGFPMEMDNFGSEQTWVISHKRVAEAAGLGKMGIHRNIIHPRFGSFVLLGTVATDAKVNQYSDALNYTPCVTCKLCVAACPTGAIASDGYFNFSACYTHNYREFMSGFTSWVENIVTSKNAEEYRAKVSDSESASMWQSLSYGANYKAAYCIAVCPAGEEVIQPFQQNRAEYLKNIVKPLQDKAEIVFVVGDSDAEAHVQQRFPNKKTKRVSNGFRPATIRAFLQGLLVAFQRRQSKGMNATYHFTFTGAETVDATVSIHDQELQVSEGHQGKPHLHVIADSNTWLRFLRKEIGILPALFKRKIKLRGSPMLMRQFAKCFPS
ncbi:MAG TPA: SCP2 sterol-binding domain-containing protein [Acidobacteriota bacterium]|nr:SCP2 sterol-binding domain-containing protein [Acidobacteriota bacterium]